MSRQIGELGEELVARWLRQTGWEILHRQYRCRWGEIDLIADRHPTLIFVEVKTRSRGNWDEDGALAITPAKQEKLIRTAEHFLSDRPDLSTRPCRFDVALVRCDRPTKKDRVSPPSPAVEPGLPIPIEGYHLTLQNYLESAFC